MLSQGNDKNRDRHKTNAADLYQNQDGQLAEQRPVGVRIVRNQAGHAGRRGGRKKSVDQRGAPGLIGGNRKHQKNCTDDDDQTIHRQDHFHG